MAKRRDDQALLTPDEMSRADQLAINDGASGAWLMENAGHAIKSVVLAAYPQLKRAVVLCGPGNNGGDGYVVARLLRSLGIETTIHRARPPKPETDAASAAAAWNGPTMDLAELALSHGDVVVDALYGAGFEGALSGADAEAAAKVNAAGVPVVAVDLPSGISGLTGQAAGMAFRANHTVTFFRAKPGHLLYPGRALCGELHVADIGIRDFVVNEIAPQLWENGPVIFSGFLPKRDALTHKYARGAAGVFSGGQTTTGAARLSAMAAARAGAGAVTMFAPSDALATHASHLTSVMLRKLDDAGDLAEILADQRLRALVIGPAFGRQEWLREVVRLVLESPTPRALVLDADVFSAFAAMPEELFAAIKASHSQVVMTPHEGEFQRVFPDLFDAAMGKQEKTRQAAQRAGATVLYKGPDTVIAAPDGRAAINANGGPELATAGSGDVLAGMLAGLLAQGMPAFEAACAGAWMHGEAGRAAGKGAVAEDLVSALLRSPVSPPDQPAPETPSRPVAPALYPRG